MMTIQKSVSSILNTLQNVCIVAMKFRATANATIVMDLKTSCSASMTRVDRRP